MIRRPVYPFVDLLPRTWLGRIGAAVGFVAMAALGFVFFAFFLAVFAVVAVVVAARFFWIMRKLRKAAEREYVHVEYTVEEEDPPADRSAGPGRRLDREDDDLR